MPAVSCLLTKIFFLLLVLSCPAQVCGALYTLGTSLKEALVDAPFLGREHTFNYDGYASVQPVQSPTSSHTQGGWVNLLSGSWVSLHSRSTVCSPTSALHNQGHNVGRASLQVVLYNSVTWYVQPSLSCTAEP
jgi:hypothetical protein